MASIKYGSLIEALKTANIKAVESSFLDLEKLLTLRTYLSGSAFGADDEQAWLAIRGNKVGLPAVRRGGYGNVKRWFEYVEAAHPEIQAGIVAAQKKEKEKRAAASKAGASYNIGLKDTEQGVVTRFPPEPSGYLHIGHAKAVFLNDYFAHEAFAGKLIVRFDDTNPTKENSEFEQSILEDVGFLGVKPDQVTYTSDYFEQLYAVAEQMIRDGHAYADDTDPEVQKEDRRNRLASKRRDRPADESLALFREMRAGSATGRKHCLRARMIFDSLNGAMRDPVVYRFPNFGDRPAEPHHRTGWTWHIYPTYDFACPVVDSLEGVTHALRTTEYADRNEQYHWFLRTLNLRAVHLWEFARINFTRTFLSKRKLTKVVDSHLVSGWDDPRMPTVRGILRRGMTVPALREFMLKQGPSRNVVLMDWTMLWATNKKLIDPVAPRHTAVVTDATAAAVTATVSGPGAPAAPYAEDRPKHPKNAAVGTKTVTFANRILIDQVDAASFAEGEEITLMAWGNAIVRRLVKDAASAQITGLDLELHLDGDFRKTEKKITWLAAADSCPALVPAELWEFDYLLTKDSLDKTDELDDFLNPKTASMTEALCDANTAALKENDIIQLERRGFYRVDKAPGKGPGGKAVLFKIPTGGKD